MKIEMRIGKIELNVDFVGGMGPLTEKEEMALSLFFSNKKAEAAKARKIAEVKTTPKAKIKA